MRRFLRHLVRALAREEPVNVSSTLVVKPGDTLIIRIGNPLSLQQAEHLRQKVKARIPGLVNVVVIECDQIAKVSAE